MTIPFSGLIVAVVAGIAFIVAYRHYSRFLADRILGLDAERETPAFTRQDGIDFVPTGKNVLFGHHFASIAGLGPIVGPAVAVYWGWLPALIWVILGAIFIGAVHDMTAMCCSLRHRGRGIGDLTGDLMGPRGRLLFLIIIFFMLALAMGLFAYVIAIVFVDLYPEAVIPVLSLMVIASVFGVLVYKFKAPLGPCTVVGVTLMMAAVWVGIYNPVILYDHDRFLPENVRQIRTDALASKSLAPSQLVAEQWKEQGKENVLNAGRPLDLATYLTEAGHPETLAAAVQEARAQARTTWIYLLLGYAFVASILPVWLLLQPRDYINSYQLYLGVIGMVIGLLVYAFATDGNSATIQAPMLNAAAADDPAAPPWLPFLFITVACGACSGFHNLVASGTTARQMQNECHARPIGYGAMVMEGMLAVLVILACTVPYASQSDWLARYGSWDAIAGGIGLKLDAFITGAAHFLAALHIPFAFAVVFMAVVVVSFAMTTLDSATRLLRFNIEELAKTVRRTKAAGDAPTPWPTRIGASLLAVVAIGFFALLELPTASATGETVMKPAGLVLVLLFGTSNQLLAGLGLLAVSLWLHKTGRPARYTAVPMVFMLCVTITAMFMQLREFWTAEPRQWTPFLTCLIILALAAWLLVEGLLAFLRHVRTRSRAGLAVEAASVKGEA